MAELWRKWRGQIEFIQISRFFPRKGVKRTHCGTGAAMLDISPDGSVHPCFKYMERSISAGSVTEHSIRRIYYESDLLHRVRSMSVDDFAVCAGCDFKYLCGGGCLADKRPTSVETCELADQIRWKLTELDWALFQPETKKVDL